MVIDLVCYRRYGHNEGDDPSYTQPLMYQRIDAKRSVRKLYTEALVRRGDITMDEAEQALDDFNSPAADGPRRGPGRAPRPRRRTCRRPTAPDRRSRRSRPGSTEATLRALADAERARVPEGFTMHPKLARQFAQRDELVAAGEVDWALGEALAVRLAAARGHRRPPDRPGHPPGHLQPAPRRAGRLRHRRRVGPAGPPRRGRRRAVAAAAGPAGRFTVHDSLLSEYAAVGFEYGYSVEAPDALVAWEAQFGDFVNGAEIIIDNFLVAAEDKWGQHAGLVLLLPHGYEGQGPEHSSARIERFLSLCARGNLRVAEPTTAAQYFHLLRSQARAGPQQPLVVFTPSRCCGPPASRSPLASWRRARFAEVHRRRRRAPTPPAVRRVVLCSGKVAHEALHRRDQRLDRGRPAPTAGDRPGRRRGGRGPGRAALPLARGAPSPPCSTATRGATEVVWLQEEPENMGAWSFVHGRLHRLLRDRFALRHVSRAESASPATGSAALHQLEQADLLDRAVG